MAQEYETQVLDINVNEIEKKLRDLGAKEDPEVFQKRWVFYIDEASWIRLRQVGERVNLCYKNRPDTAIAGTEEIEVEVKDFDKTSQLISKLDFYYDQYYQENKRKLFTLDGVEVSIDSWPQIPPYLEIDASSEKKVKETLKKLGLEGKDVGHMGTNKIYAKYGIDLHANKELTFSK
ncbi:adenylate cyclase [candidate division WS5 bacterium]|uniref:Adenylate cyclase n=1 Tax=candidate division WS5 bacterium TaxID=2093353 RepID=A0A419DG26_9BACT|nr:MAG: adenylate cyclase [candidate division WS5 bacterium]